MLLAGIALRWTIPLNLDVAWFLIAAGRMMAGGSYSADFFDMNMPLAIALYIPPQALHLATGISVNSALTAWSVALIVQCLVLVRALGRSSADRAIRALTSAPGLAWLAFVLVSMPVYDFGQREHLAFALFLPFIVMLADERPPSRSPLRTYVSILAAIGFMLKPHYAALPVLLLSIRAWRLGSLAPFREVEMMSLLMVGLCNALVVCLRFPDWFTCAHWAMDLYGAYHRNSIIDLAAHVLVWSWLPAIAVFVVATGRARCRGPLLQMLFCTVAYGIVVFVLQFKGWRYQLLPALSALMMAVPALWVRGRDIADDAPGNGWRRSLALLMAGASLVPIAIAQETAPRVYQMPRSLIAKALSPAAAGDYVYCLSTSVEPFFPTITLLGLQWGSRFSPLWPMAGLGAAIQAGDVRSHDLLNRYYGPLMSAVNADFLRYQPTLVIVDRRDDQMGIPPGFDMLGFMLHDPAFRQTWSSYQRIGASADFEVYARSAP